MSRFEKKCFIGSAAFHGLLLVVFLFGSAFFSSSKPKDMGPVVTISGQITDKPFNTGGNPNANPAQSSPPPPQPEPPKPELIKPEPRPEPPKPEPIKVKPVETKLVEKEKGVLPVRVSKPKEISKTTSSLTNKISTTLVKRSDSTAVAQMQRDAAERDRKYKQELARYQEQQRRIAGEIGGIIGGVGKSLGKSTVAEAIGPGGAAYVNYGSLIGEIYKRAVYATQPQSDEDTEAVIKVVVARNGTVRNSQWSRRTGNSVLDKAVDRAMSSVRSLPEFPPESKDSERSFNIRIAFEAKKVSA